MCIKQRLPETSVTCASLIPKGLGWVRCFMPLCAKASLGNAVSPNHLILTWNFELCPQDTDPSHSPQVALYIWLLLIDSCHMSYPGATATADNAGGLAFVQNSMVFSVDNIDNLGKITQEIFLKDIFEGFLKAIELSNSYLWWARAKECHAFFNKWGILFIWLHKLMCLFN